MNLTYVSSLRPIGKKITSRWTIFFLEQALLAATLGMILLVASKVANLQLSNGQLTAIFLFHAVVASSGMLLFKTHAGIIRYSEMRDVSRVLGYSIFQAALWTFLFLLLKPQIKPSITISVIATYSSLSAILMVVFRLAVKQIYILGFRSGKGKERILIYGAGAAGLATQRALAADISYNGEMMGFLDDDPAKVGKHVAGKNIYGTDPQALSKLLRRAKIRKIIIAADLPTEKKSWLASAGAEYGVEIRTLPPLENVVNGEIKIDKLQNLRIESLLGREEIRLLNEQNVKELSGATVLVTGSAGSIGSEICRQLCRYPLQKLVLLDQSETGLHDAMMELRELALETELVLELASIRDKTVINDIVQRHEPQFIFHAAAYKHVPILEAFPREVVLTNIRGTQILADAALKAGVRKFVMISTDKAVNPTNVMGASKRAAEIYVQFQNERGRTQFITTRFGNVLGSNGSVVPIFKTQIRNGGPVTVTDPRIERYFMTIPEASSLVLEAAVMGNGGEIFVFDMGKPIKIVDLANKMIELAGKRPGRDIRIEFTGLRPGEKMYEELFHNREILLQTHHPRIMRARKSEPDATALTRIEHLTSVVDHCDPLELPALIRDIVPEYAPETGSEGSVRIIRTVQAKPDTINKQILNRAEAT